MCALRTRQDGLRPNQCARDTGCHDRHVMELFDAGFNGWGFVDYSVHKHDINGHRGEQIQTGTLSAGHFGVDDVCIRDPGCYSVTLAWGWWAEEVSWTLGAKGIGPVATGGAPAQCDFSVGGDYCPATCATPPQLTGCDSGKLPYELELYDDEGDGWSGAQYTISDKDDHVVTTGTLLGGFQ